MMNGSESRPQWMVWLAVAFALSFLALLSPRTAAAAGKEDGKALYVKNECTKCHSIITLGIEMVPDEEEEAEDEEDEFGEEEEVEDPPDLSGIGATWTHGEAGMKKWLIKKLEIEGELHQKKFPGKQGELKSLVAWLMTLTEKAPAE